MFQVNWSAKHFGFIGLDIFIDDAIKDSIPAMSEILAEQMNEPVMYRITDL